MTQMNKAGGKVEKLEAALATTKAQAETANAEINRIEAECKAQLVAIVVAREAEIKAAEERAVAAVKETPTYKMEFKVVAAAYMGDGYEIGIRAVQEAYPKVEIDLVKVDMTTIDLKAIRARIAREEAEEEEVAEEEAGHVGSKESV